MFYLLFILVGIFEKIAMFNRAAQRPRGSVHKKGKSLLFKYITHPDFLI